MRTEVYTVLKRKGIELLSTVLFALSVVVAVDGQVFLPPGATDAGMGGSNAITGMVLHSGGRLERRVSVRLQSMTKGERTAITDEYGNFAFRGLPPGDYIIVIDKEKDFQPFSQSVSVIQPRGFPPVTQNLSIRLIPRANNDGKPGVVNADTAGVPKSALDLYNQAVELAKNGDRPGAIVKLNLAIAEYPNFMLAYNEMGVQYLRLKDLARSEDAYKSALKIDAKAYMPLVNYGILLVAQKRWTEAEPLLRKALEIKADSAVAHYFLGQSLAYQGKFPEGEKELVQALANGGDEMNEGRRLLAILYSSRGNKGEAAKELETYLKLAPNAPDAERLRATIRQLKGETPASNKPNP